MLLSITIVPGSSRPAEQQRTQQTSRKHSSNFLIIKLLSVPKPTLSIAISDNNLGLAVFQEQRLTFLEAHSLTGVPKPAEASAGFVFRAMDSFNPDTAVLQCSSEEPENIRAAILEALQAANCPVQEISEQQVLASFGDPPIKSKEELRYLMRVLFPQVPPNRLVFSCLDAVATGLYFETQRLLADDQ